mmetsp:Transcript_13213/g.15116  ORF Transcript_13213/g.15116 Transcript_13213/m.15116 type:complete len:298 (+) Transcript_13213:348-1241(+)|eukprot:CAMPEP_0184013512 /NCGR_PEP_ID=MMETSP0954-20121128/5061_1 /TAXON_ID=627963 /ORGANISM="Aplanochytrium sp, Strain PBS07" /LENGTH=297 /DNA_ID=CAMNT_0026293723 /DNA_START=262 /DNA_END=1155 /DNA_ORIENTATION=+
MEKKTREPVAQHKDATLQMIADAAVQVAMMKMVEAQLSFQDNMTKAAIKTKEAAQLTAEKAKVFANEAAIATEELNKKMDVWGREASDAILRSRDKMMKEAEVGYDAAKEALSHAAGATKEELIKLQRALHEANEHLGEATARAAVYTMLAAAVVSECYEETQKVIISTSKEVIDMFWFVEEAVVTKITKIHDEAMQSLRERMERRRLRRAARRARMKAAIEAWKQEWNSKVQAAKNKIYEQLEEEIERHHPPMGSGRVSSESLADTFSTEQQSINNDRRAQQGLTVQQAKKIVEEI